MVFLKPIPVALPEGKVPTKQIAKDIVAFFLPKEWKYQDPETISIIYSTSFTNPNCIVERPAPFSSTPEEPLKLFIKFHDTSSTGIPAFQELLPTKEEEAVLADKYYQSGLGAKVYGLFQTQDGTIGRIDEFLDSRHLEPEDVEEETLREDVARGLATFHGMNVALPQKPVTLYYDALSTGLARYHNSAKLKGLARKGGVSLDNLLEYDIVSRIHRVVAELESINAKTAWCIHDIQSMNILVKNSSCQNYNNNHSLVKKQSQVTLIDFEFVFRNYRAFDIGGHFMQKLFKWFDTENKIAKCRPYTEEEKMHFCEIYAAQWNVNQSNNSSAGEDEDTGELVHREAELGYLLAITFDLHNMLWYMDHVNDEDPLNLEGLNRLFELFQEQYKGLGLEKSGGY